MGCGTVGRVIYADISSPSAPQYVYMALFVNLVQPSDPSKTNTIICYIVTTLMYNSNKVDYDPISASRVSPQLLEHISCM